MQGDFARFPVLHLSGGHTHSPLIGIFLSVYRLQTIIPEYVCIVSMQNKFCQSDYLLYFCTRFQKEINEALYFDSCRKEPEKF